MPVSDTELLMQILDLVDKPKRRDAYVTERFFEESVLPCLVSGDYSTGWCYVSLTNNSSNDRAWFKVMPFLDCEDCDKEREVVRKIAGMLMAKNQAQEFYVVYISDDGSNGGRTEGRLLANNITIGRLQKNNEKWFLTKRTFPDLVDLNKMKSGLENLLSGISPDDGFCEKWMRGCDYTYLMKLLLQRVLMNYGLGQQWPVDVDAIEIDKNGRMVVHEFKRKNPCPNGCYAFGEEVTNIGVKIDEIRNKSLSMPLKSVVEHLGYHRKNVLCYGLDVSHLRNFEYCTKWRIGYRYTIWDSTDYGDKPSINDLFTINDKGVLHPKRGMNLLSQEINPRHFIGFAATKGKDSGSFNNRLRIQATISKDVFKKVEWPCLK